MKDNENKNDEGIVKAYHDLNNRISSLSMGLSYLKNSKDLDADEVDQVITKMKSGLIQMESRLNYLNEKLKKIMVR